MIWEPGASRPLTEEQRSAWDSRITRAEHVRKSYEPQWKRALERYSKAATSEAPTDVNALLDFRHVETKKAQLFYQTPEVQLHPIDPQNPELPGEAILPLRQKVLNDRLGPDGTDVKRTVHGALFDALAASGFLVTEIGYEDRKAPAPPNPDGTPMVGPDGMPITEVPIWGMPFWMDLSSMKLLIPDDFKSTRFDKAPWLGLQLSMPLSRGKREFNLPDDFTGSTTRDEHVFEHADSSQQQGDPQIEYTKIWYRAELFDDSIINPELYRLLILVKGLDKEAKHVDSPFQTVDQLGQLSTDSMRGNPIHQGTLRHLSDSAYIPSDLVVGEQLSKEINKFRTGLIRNRVARTPFTLIDPEGFEASEIEKIKTGEKTVFTKPGELLAGRVPIQSAQPGQEPRDNYTAQEYAERDHRSALGTSENQAGQVAQKKTTATEARIVQTNSGARAEAEKDRLREWFVAGVRKFDAVLQRTMTPADLTTLLGQQGAALWDQWRTMSGCYVYKILPDSGVHVDAAQFRAQKLDEYNLLRKDPLINAPELLKPIARALGYDPAKTILPQAPESGPEPIKTSFAFKGEDLIGPQSQAVVEILAQMGISVSPAAIATLQQAGLMVQAGIIGKDGLPVPPPTVPGGEATHGGSAPTTAPVNKHQQERTGGVNGMPH